MQDRASPRGRNAAIAALVVAMAWTVVLLMGADASAHAIVEETTPRVDEVVPQPPPRVVMDFNEPVELSFGAIRVFDTNGRRVDEGETEHVEGKVDAAQVALRPELAKGTYTVTWKVISADGHPISEAFVFHVEEPGENPEGIADDILEGQGGGGGVAPTIFGVVRWAVFAALLLLGGTIAFACWIWGRGTRPPATIDESFRARWIRIALGASIAAAVGTALAFVLQGSVAGGISIGEAIGPDALREVAATRFGKVALVRIALLVVVAGALIWARRSTALRRESAGAAAGVERPPTWWLVGVGVMITALLATPGVAGHAGTSSPVALNLAADTIHVLAAAVWFGGLVMLVGVAFPVTKAGSERARAEVLAPVVMRFSNAALVAVAALVATGIYRSWVEVQALRALTGATYGVVLLTKVAVFLPAVALGAVNNYSTKKRLAKVSRGEGGGTPLRTLRRLVGVEVALIMVVLAVTALLVNLPPAKVEAGVEGPFTAETKLGDYDLDVIVDPNKVGENLIHLMATTPDGATAPIKEMRVLFRMPSQDIGPLRAPASPGEGHFIVEGRHLSVAGEWQLEIVARIDRFTEERATVSLVVNE